MSAFARRAAGATWWSALEIVSRYGVQFIVTIFLARLLSSVDFGLIAILVVFTSIGGLLVDSGFGAALIQRQRATDDDETTAFICTTVTGLILCLTLFAVAPAIATFFNQPPLKNLMRFASLLLPLGGLAAIPDAVLSMRLSFRIRTHAQIYSSLVSGVFGVALAVGGFGAWSVVWQLVIASAVRLSILWIASGWRPRGCFRAASFRSLGRYGSYMLLSGLLDTVAVRTQSLLIGRLFSTSELGYYTLAQTAQQAPASVVGGILSRVGLPLFSSIAHDRVKLREALKATLSMSMFLFMPCMMGLSLAARPLLSMIYGERWLEAAPIVSILALGTSLWPIHVLNLSAISAQGRSDLFFRLEVIKAISTTGFVLVACRWGAVGVAWATVAGALLAAYINIWYSGKNLDYGICDQLGDQAATVILTAVAALIGFSILHWTKAGSLNTFLAVLASAAGYVLLAISHRPRAFRDLMALRHAFFSASVGS